MNDGDDALTSCGGDGDGDAPKNCRSNCGNGHLNYCVGSSLINNKISKNQSYIKTNIAKVGRPLERSKKTDLILTLYKHNYKITDIARKTGLSRTTIYKVLYDFGLKKEKFTKN